MGTKFIFITYKMTGTADTSTSFSLAAKVKDYFQLIKFTLSFTVVFSCVICYLLAPNVVEYNLGMILILFIAGMLVTGSANAINQAVEKDTDAVMKRTSKRPVADGRMSQQEAYIFATVAGLAGVFMMGWFFKNDENGFNWDAALLSAFQFVSVCIYLYAIKEDQFDSGIDRRISRGIALFDRMGGCNQYDQSFRNRCGKWKRVFQCRWMDLICDTVSLAVPAFLGYCLGSSRGLQ